MDNMNIDPQLQNPNISSVTPNVSNPNPRPMNVPMKKKSSAFMIAVIVLAVVGAGIWWYLRQMVVEPVAQQPAAINQQARDEAKLNSDIQTIDLGNVDQEFRAIDSNLNSL